MHYKIISNVRGGLCMSKDNRCLKCSSSIKGLAYSCVHHCTYCHSCASKLQMICLNCNGKLTKKA
ncbi:DUF1272 domain-containing protein [Alkalihalobacillus trypoxylicola]|uniref:DUF1272 domain-containing protein n=2 Tax=Alkalihalobacillus trypoxylicola TaxID=519424 RepID=UPI002E0ED18D